MENFKVSTKAFASALALSTGLFVHTQASGAESTCTGTGSNIVECATTLIGVAENAKQLYLAEVVGVRRGGYGGGRRGGYGRIFNRKGDFTIQLYKRTQQLFSQTHTAHVLSAMNLGKPSTDKVYSIKIFGAHRDSGNTEVKVVGKVYSTSIDRTPSLN